MTRKTLAGLFAAVLLAGLPAIAQKVYVDYDQSAEFTSYKTFAWGASPQTSLQAESPLMHSRIKNAIEYQLTTGGLVEDTNDPDLYVTYHTSTREEVQLHTSGLGYGYGGGWLWDPFWGPSFGSSTTTSHTYQRGTLIIDIWDARTKQAIWRGTAQAVVKENPQRVAKQIDKAVAKIVKKFDKMYAKDMRQLMTRNQ